MKLFNKPLAYVLQKLVFISALLSVNPVLAHDLNFGYLDIEKVEAGQYTFLFRYSSKAFDLASLSPKMPDTCEVEGFMREGYASAERTFRWAAKCSGPDAQAISLSEVGITGLPEKQRLFVRYKAEGEASVERVVDQNPLDMAELLKPAETQQSSSGQFFLLGAEHLLGGYDHLLIVLCFLLLFSRYSTLLWTVSGFTIGHSLSLIAASFGWLKVSAAPVELLIALSVALLAREIFMNKSEPSLLKRFPIIVSLGIGLLHGLGFSFALSELGLPEEHKVLALLMFNLGIEFGQLLFIVVILGLVLPALRWLARALVTLLKQEDALLEIYIKGFRQFTALIIGAVSLMWVLQRI